MATEKASALLSTSEIEAIRKRNITWPCSDVDLLLAHVEAQDQNIAGLREQIYATNDELAKSDDARAQAEAALREAISQAYITGVKRDELSATVAEQAAIIGRLRDALAHIATRDHDGWASEYATSALAAVRDEKELTP